jgi:hypothetical protein
MLSVAFYLLLLLSVIMLSVIMLNVVMQSVVAPVERVQQLAFPGLNRIKLFLHKLHRHWHYFSQNF